MFYRYIYIAVLALSLCGFTTAIPDPAQAQIVTTDVEHFWQAFHDAAKMPPKQRTAIYLKEYFEPGSCSR